MLPSASMYRRVASGLLAVAAFLSLCGGVKAEGLMVRPSKFELSTPAGKVLQIPITVTNLWREANEIEAYSVVLLQGRSGDYQFAFRDKVPAGAVIPRCSADWLTVTPTTAGIRSGGDTRLMATLAVPRDVRGSFACAVLVRNKPGTGTGIHVVVQVVCPMIITVVGAPAQQKVELRDATLVHVVKGDDEQPTTTTGLMLYNTGETYEKVSGQVIVMRQVGAKWREVTRQELQSRGLLAGAAMRLETDLKRRFPPGKYKLIGQLNIGGRVRANQEFEVDFAGDPAAPPLVDDVSLLVDPAEALVEVGPGGRRSVLVNLTNPSDQEIEITFGVSMPTALVGVALGELQGPQLSAADWVSLSPKELPLRANGQRSIRLVVEEPQDAKPLPSHYALVEASVKYADGHVDKRAVTMVMVRHPRLTPELAAAPLPIALARAEDSKYSLTCRFGNVGSKEFRATAMATVAPIIGPALVEAKLDGPTNLLLPLSIAQFGGLLDFAAVPPGTYKLSVHMMYGGAMPAVARSDVSVTEANGQKVVTVVEPGVAPASSGKDAGAAQQGNK